MILKAWFLESIRALNETAQDISVNVLAATSIKIQLKMQIKRCVLSHFTIGCLHPFAQLCYKGHKCRNTRLPLLLHGNWDLNQHSVMINSQFKWMKYTRRHCSLSQWVCLSCVWFSTDLYFLNIKFENRCHWFDKNGLNCICDASNPTTVHRSFKMKNFCRFFFCRNTQHTFLFIRPHNFNNKSDIIEYVLHFGFDCNW